MSDEQIGHVSAYYSKIGVAAIELTATLSVGEKIKVKGATTDFEIEVTSMQIDHEVVDEPQGLAHQVHHLVGIFRDPVIVHEYAGHPLVEQQADVGNCVLVSQDGADRGR